MMKSGKMLPHLKRKRQMFPKTAAFNARYFPLHLAVLSVGENILPISNWMVISKEPFRFIIAMGVGNHSLTLIKKYKEAALHFLPWSERERVVRAGHISGRKVNKAEALGFHLLPAEKLKHTKLIEGADSIYEMKVHLELFNLSREFVPFVMEVIATHGAIEPTSRQPILYLSQEDFATLGERWEYTS
jgi:flavin reductase (DIM6/NTAB) family NADH-FMN oxidoreductase RutF